MFVSEMLQIYDLVWCLCQLYKILAPFDNGDLIYGKIKWFAHSHKASQWLEFGNLTLTTMSFPHPWTATIYYNYLIMLTTLNWINVELVITLYYIFQVKIRHWKRALLNENHWCKSFMVMWMLITVICKRVNVL